MKKAGNWRAPGFARTVADSVYESFYSDLRGTLPPSRRASDRPIAIACLRLFTVLPERPDLSLPSFISCIARWTFFEALGPYFFPEPFLAVGITTSDSSPGFLD